MKHSSGIVQRGRRLQQILDWLQSPWPPVDGDWRPAEALLHRFIRGELGEHVVIDPIPSCSLEANSLGLQFMDPPFTTKPWGRPLHEKLSGVKLPPGSTH